MLELSTYVMILELFMQCHSNSQHYEQSVFVAIALLSIEQFFLFLIYTNNISMLNHWNESLESL